MRSASAAVISMLQRGKLRLAEVKSGPGTRGQERAELSDRRAARGQGPLVLTRCHVGPWEPPRQVALAARLFAGVPMTFGELGQ